MTKRRANKAKRPQKKQTPGGFLREAREWFKRLGSGKNSAK